MKKSKPSRKKQSNLSRVLASSNRGPVVVERFFSSLTAGEIRRAVPVVARHRHFTEAIQLDSGEKMFYAKRTPNADLEKLISWCLGIVEVHADPLRFFVDAQDRVLEHLLQADGRQLLRLLDDIDGTCGLSTWSIGIRSSLLAAESQELKREYISGLISRASDNGFFKSIVFNVSTRLDDIETLPSEARFFEQKIRRTFSGERLHYLMYKLLPYNAEFDYDFEHVLQTEKESSPVDVLQCLLDFLIFNVSETQAETHALCKRVVGDLYRAFPKGIIAELAVAYGLARPTAADRRAMRILDLYTAGDYELVCDEMAAEPTLASTFALVEIWAKALTRCPKSMPATPIAAYLRPLCDVLLKTGDFERSRAILLAHSYAYGVIPWLKELRFLLDRETRFYSPAVNQRLKETSLLISSFVSPAKQYILSRRGDTPLDATQDCSVTVKLFSRIYSASTSEPQESEFEGIESDRKIKYRAQWYSSQRRYEVAIPLLLSLRASGDIRVAQDANRSLVEAYLSSGQVEDAADVFVQAVLENPNLLSVFDSAGLCEACTRIISESKSVAISIALSLHTRHVNDNFGAALKYAFERFLTNNGLVEPLDVLRVTGISTNRVNYFLEHVCTPDVMKLYLHFDTSKQIEEARIQICRILLEKGVSPALMEFEIKDRTLRLVLREATTQVDQSRIYSDVNLLSGPSAGTFKTLFERFSVARQGTYSDFEDEKALAKFADLMERDPMVRSHAHALHIQDLVLNEKNVLFLKLLKLVRDEFAFGDRGLNVYLSTRIRHGHLPNTLRRPLLDNNLLASRATDAGSYRLNSSWADALRLPHASRKDVEHALMEFSMKFASLVDELNDQWLRLFSIDQDISGLSTDAASKTAFFNYSVSSVESYYLQTQLDDNSTYTEFVGLATSWLWSRTERNLASIRLKLDELMRPRALELLEELQRTVIQRCGIERLGDTPDSIVRARIGLSQALDTVRSWFTRATGASIASFELDVPILIAQRAADAPVNWQDNSGMTFNGAALNAFVDIFYNLFENCVSKSSLEKDRLWVEARATSDERGMVITVDNNCDEVEDFAARNHNLRRYAVSLGKPEHTSADASGIGGSGFFKISRALAKDLSLAHSIELGYVSPHQFRVEIVIPAGELQKVKNHENPTH